MVLRGVLHKEKALHPSEFQIIGTLPFLFKRAECKEIAWWAILAKDPDCAKELGDGLRK
jgi:hypothetical protein